MKIIVEFQGDDIKGSFVTDTKEYDVTGKVTNREPLEVRLVSLFYYYCMTDNLSHQNGKY